jgi:transcriptional regulator with XRE-family HTH domain
LADAVGVSPTLVARVERGDGGRITTRRLEAIAQALSARVELRLSWNGEALDRLLDADHARAVEAMATLLRDAGWTVAVEVTFAIRGERGSIDLLAWHSAARVVLVVEVKTVVPDIQAMLLSLDRKTRLALEIAGARGWPAAAVGKPLVVVDSRTARRRVAALAVTFETEFPHRLVDVRRWIREPSAATPLRGLWFLPIGPLVTGRQRAAKR